MQSLITLWKNFRSNYWLTLGFDLFVIVIALWGIHAWQTRDLPLGEPSPLTILPLLAGGNATAAIQPGSAGVVYFFAPWCTVCKHSIDNLDEQLQDGSIDWATAIALDYSGTAEVAEFVAGTEITLPVLLGSSKTIRDWNIRAFPTYFVIDASGNIHSRSVGYSTAMGLQWRTWLAKLSDG